MSSVVKADAQYLLTLNGGSSSIKFAIYANGEPLKRGLYGAVDRIGMSGTTLKFNDQATQRPQTLPLATG